MFDRFDSVTVMSSGRAWAVGDYYTGHEGGANGAFIEEWTRRRWHLVGRPLPSDLLWSVSASGLDDAWAAGDHLVEHWDGRGWRRVATARVRGGSIFNAVAAHGRADAWLVGERWRGNRLVGKTFVEHWDGKRWSVVPSADPVVPGHRRYDAILQAVDARSASDAWAVGYSIVGRRRNVFRTLVEHWDGQRWQIVPSPNVRASDGVRNDILFAVSGGRRNAWAVGSWADYAGGYGGAGDHALALHWNGRRWSRVTPARIRGRSLLHGVVARGGTVWAVGDRGVPPHHRALIEGWHGSRWTVAPSPSGFDLAAVSATRGGTSWAVGAIGRRPLAARLVCLPG